MSKITKGRGYVYSLQYHFVWCVKYRRKILDEAIDDALRGILQKVSEDHGFSITEYNSNLDHVHLLVDCSPQHYIPDMMKALKGVSGRLLMKEHGEKLSNKLWGGHVWNPSYFVATVSENTEEQIRDYINSQKER
jgi:putative transposase